MNQALLIKLAVAAGLVYSGMKYGGLDTKKAIGGALVALGAASLVRSAPIVNQYV